MPKKTKTPKQISALQSIVIPTEAADSLTVRCAVEGPPYFLSRQSETAFPDPPSTARVPHPSQPHREGCDVIPSSVTLKSTQSATALAALFLTFGAAAQTPTLPPAQIPPPPPGQAAQTLPVPTDIPQQLPPTLPAYPPDAPTASTVPQQALPAPVPLPQPGIDAPGPQPTIPAVTSFVPNAPAAAPRLTQDEDTKATPKRSEPSGLRPDLLGFLGPYRRPTVPELFPGSNTRLTSLIKDDKLYLTLHDAIALAIENNLDVEVERDNLVLADTDLIRAQGGGNLRGIDYSIQETPNGVGAPGSPLLNNTANAGNPSNPAVTDLTSLNSSTQAQSSLSQLSTAIYSSGPNVPLFDPSFFAEAGYLQRSDSVSLESTGTTGATTTTTGTLHFVAANLSYVQGFHTGAQLELTANNASPVTYGSVSQRDPFSTPSTSSTLTQPLLRGRGSVNTRYLRIANLDKKTSRLLFEQQVLETIYGISRLYFDLVSLGENVTVQQESLRAAQKLTSDDTIQVQQGTLAPIELTRVQSLVSSTNYDLIQAQSLYRQQEIILRNQLIRSSSPVFSAQFSEIVPTDRIAVPDHLDPASSGFDTLEVPALVQQGLARRPDLAQSALQIESGKLSVKASRNQALPQLNLYGNVQTRGVSEQSFETLGTTGTAIPTIPQNFATGGLKTSTIYQGGIQLTLPLRNRTAQADAARDAVQLRQVQARTEKLSDQIRVDIENAVIALQTAQAAYEAARTSRGYQEQLLQSVKDQLSVGASTQLLVVQNQSNLAQARSTEIAARANWKKAQIDLDHALGDLLDKNNITLDDAITGAIPNPNTP
jgi:outer membrane protein